MVLNPVEHGLSFAGHVTNVVRPQIVHVQQLVGKSTISGSLRCLDDHEGTVGEENLDKLLPHRRSVNNETRGKRPRVSASEPTTAPAKKMGPLAHISSS